MNSGSRYRVCLTVLGTAYVLRTCVPHPVALANRLRSPRAWVAEAGPDAAAGVLAGALLWLVALWVACALAAAAVSLLPGRLGRLGHAVAHRMTPAALRRVVITAAGTSILLSPVSALAAPATGGTPATGAASVLPPLGWPTDPEPSTSPHTEPAPLTQPRPSGDPGPSGQATTGQATTGQVTVRPGDSLWSITADRLGATPSAARIQAEWPRWYAANRQVIGADPNLIRPGVSLRAPAPARTDTGA
jgi:nucleoid-associated protein YgaU